MKYPEKGKLIVRTSFLNVCTVKDPGGIYAKTWECAVFKRIVSWD
jgi:hypothetical protein